MKRKKISFEALELATQSLELIGLENRAAVKKKYLKLSKKYHPDMLDGDTKKFQEINEAYKLIEQYMDQFCFHFTKDEFYHQYPHAKLDDEEWFKRKH